MRKTWQYGKLVYDLPPQEQITNTAMFLEWNHFSGASYYTLISCPVTGGRSIVLEIRVLDNVWEENL